MAEAGSLTPLRRSHSGSNGENPSRSIRLVSMAAAKKSPTCRRADPAGAWVSAAVEARMSRINHQLRSWSSSNPAQRDLSAGTGFLLRQAPVANP